MVGKWEVHVRSHSNNHGQLSQYIRCNSVACRGNVSWSTVAPEINTVPIKCVENDVFITAVGMYM